MQLNSQNNPARLQLHEIKDFMTQINPISTAQKHEFKKGDQVRTDLFPDQVLTILRIDGKIALLKTTVGNTKWVALRRLRSA